MFTFINEAQMPSCLRKDDFCIWHRKINNVLGAVGLLPKVTDCLNIEFSEEKKTVTHGTLSIGEIKKQIRELWNVDERVDDLLSEIRSAADYRDRQLGSALAELIHISNPAEPYKAIRKRLDELFGEAQFDEYILGEYCHSTKTVILYTKNIARTLSAGRTAEQGFEAVFAHELFHAYHYQGDEPELTLRRDYTGKVVKESLAAAFEWTYCALHGIAGGDGLRRSWETHPVLSYPYSGARYLIDWRKNAVRDVDFVNIYRMSLTDMDGALRILVSSEEFYGIKNRLCVCGGKPAKSPSKKLTRAELEALYVGKSVGQIAREEIPPIIRSKPSLISELLDSEYSKSTFKISYAVLATTRVYKSGNYRYFPESTTISATEYFVCSQWLPKHRDALLDWVWKNRA